MRIILSILIFTQLTTDVFSQQIPQYSHHILNYFAINPAFAGGKKCLDLKLGYRKQWTGFDAAPKTAFANMHGKIGKGKYNFHGLGGRVDSDDAGPLSYTALNLAYAYHMRVNHKSTLSAGVAAGFAQWRIDGGAITLPETGYFDDPVLAATDPQFIYPTVDFGLWWYRDDRFIGIGIRNLVEKKIKEIGNDTWFNRHYVLTGAKVIEMGDDFFFKPSVNFRYLPNSKPSIDFIGQVDYNSKVSLGIGARNGFGLIGMVKIDAFDYITIAYAYDLSLSKMRFDGRHTHEIVLGIQACAQTDKARMPCSAYD
jgi:type IX secretion system PorP/SprF family membrane protein